MTMPLLALSLAVPIFVGYSLVLSLAKNTYPIPFLPKLAIAYGLGFGLLTQWMLIIGMANISYSFESIAFPILFFIPCILWSCCRRKDQILKYQWKRPRFTVFEFIMISYLIWNLVFVFLIALNVPLIGWDVLATSSFNAKIIYIERSLEFLKNFPHSSYPLHIIFSQVWVSITIGSWDEQLVKIIFPVYFFCFLIIQYYFLSQFLKSRWAMLGIVLLSSSNFFTFHAGFAYRDLPLAYYSCSAIFFLILWHKQKGSAWLLLAALFSGLSSFVKTEGLLHAFVHLCTLIFILLKMKETPIKEKLKHFKTYALINFFICGLYPAYSIFFVFKDTKGPRFNFNNLIFHFSKDNFQNIYLTISRFLEDFFILQNWNIIWLIFVLSFFQIKKKNISFEILILLFSLTCFLALSFLSFSFSSLYALLDRDLSRCIFQIFPLVPALIVLILFSPKDKAC